MKFKFMTPDGACGALQIDIADLLNLVQRGQLRAHQIAGQLRFSAENFKAFLNGCAVHGDAEAPMAPRRDCKTFAGRKKFSYVGSVETGTKIWVGTAMLSPLRFTKEQWAALLGQFREKTIPAGLSFDKPEAGSMGDWIQANWKTKIGPATYVGGILIAEGYAERTRPGEIRFFGVRREPSGPTKEPRS